MRLFIIACCTFLAGCGHQPRTSTEKTAGNYIDGNHAESNADNGTVGPPQAPVISSALDELFELPESNLHTKCAAADYYPKHRVQPAFYGYPSPPEYDRYVECLLAEARRDGGRKRLASPTSFPKIGTCYATRIRSMGFGGPNGRSGSTSVDFDNGLYLTDYSYIPQVARSRVGDEVRACVRELPTGCPGYDLRGIYYRTKNLRTGEVWEMYDSLHACRGA